MSGATATFSCHLWCQVIPQAENQLKILRQSNIHPTISTYAHVYGQKDYNVHPFVPIGMEKVVHDKSYLREKLLDTAEKEVF